MNPIIHWFRRDLRLADNTALNAASQTNRAIIPLFIFDPAIILSQRLSVPRLAWLIETLKVLEIRLREQDSYLLIGYGHPKLVLDELIHLSGANAVYFNRDYTPLALKRDAEVKKHIYAQVYAYDDVGLLPPGTLFTRNNRPFTVFTPFKHKWLTVPKQPLQTVKSFSSPFPNGIQTVSPEVLKGLLNDQRVHWLSQTPTMSDFGFAHSVSLPDAGENAASKRLNNFLNQRVYHYDEGRNQLGTTFSDDTFTGSSFLSPYLRFGALSARQAYWGGRNAYQRIQNQSDGHSVESWVSELIWRDFYMDILFHFPYVLKDSFRPVCDRVEWQHAPNELQAWKDGTTGYPVVDAAMRQLRHMGWIPNRARMIVASFLSKDLLIDWREGERYFMDWLIDGDPSANNGGWQWSAGTGTDAQPYFRIFNPISQSKQFDAEGTYIRRWIPELKDVPTKHIHEPWRMDSPPRNYPPPIVDHQVARERTLAAFKGIKM